MAKGYAHLNAEERERIAVGLSQGWSVRARRSVGRFGVTEENVTVA